MYFVVRERRKVFSIRKEGEKKPTSRIAERTPGSESHKKTNYEEETATSPSKQ